MTEAEYDLRIREAIARIEKSALGNDKGFDEAQLVKGPLLLALVFMLENSSFGC